MDGTTLLNLLWFMIEKSNAEKLLTHASQLQLFPYTQKGVLGGSLNVKTN